MLRLRGTLLEDQLVLGGSSGLLGFATSAPAFTDDADFLIREDLVVDERAQDPAFREGLRRILGRFDSERRSDALGDAQMSFLSLQRDPEFRDHGAEGYARFLDRVEAGYRQLVSLLGAGSHG